MLSLGKRLVRRALRIPGDPGPPAGSEASVRVFRASPRYRRYVLMRWGVRQAGVVIGLLFALFFGQFFLAAIGLADLDITDARDEVPGFTLALGEKLGILEQITPEPGQRVRTRLSLSRALAFAETFGVLFVAIQLPLTLILTLLDYELRWYIVTDRSLRIREGVGNVSELTMTFANVQNLSIRQGPIQRLFGIADLRVRSAGGGAGSGSDRGSGEDGEDKHATHIGYFRGIDNAEALRATVLDRLGELDDAGLGETAAEPVRSGVAATPSAPGGAALDAARRVLEEARALRRAVG